MLIIGKQRILPFFFAHLSVVTIYNFIFSLNNLFFLMVYCVLGPMPGAKNTKINKSKFLNSFYSPTVE